MWNALIIGTLMLPLAAAIATWSCAYHWHDWVSICAAVAVAHQWQTLIGASLALASALVASRIVWGQLRQMHRQSAVMVRGVLVDRLLETERLFDECEALLAPVSSELFAFPGDITDPASYWAQNAETPVHSARIALRESPYAAVPSDIKVKLTEVLRLLDALSEEIRTINGARELQATKNRSDEITKGDLTQSSDESRKSAQEIPRLAACFKSATSALLLQWKTEIEDLHRRLGETDSRIKES